MITEKEKRFIAIWPGGVQVHPYMPINMQNSSLIGILEKFGISVYDREKVYEALNQIEVFPKEK